MIETKASVDKPVRMAARRCSFCNLTDERVVVSPIDVSIGICIECARIIVLAAGAHAAEQRPNGSRRCQ